MTVYNKLVRFMLDELKKVANSGAIISTVTIIYVFIDTFAYLAMPLCQSENNKNDYINWVNTYLKTNGQQKYQYQGKDMYGARCGLLHAFISISEYAKRENCNYYGYHNGPNHMFDGKGPLVLISVNRLVKDFCDAIIKFFTAASKDKELKSRIDSRINLVYSHFNIVGGQADGNND